MSFNVDEKEIRKTRTKATAMTILNLVKDIEVNDLIESLFIQSDDEPTRKMLKDYEKQLILAKLKPEEFNRDLNMFYTNMARYIKKNNLLKNFLLLYYIVFKNQNENALSNNVIFKLYMNIIPQQVDYLSKKEEIICGIDSKGKPISIKDPYPYIDYPAFILRKNKREISIENLKKEYKRFGYYIKNENDVSMLFNEYTLISNSINLNSFLIDENTIDMVSFNHLTLSYLMNIPEYNLDDEMLSHLNRRSRFLKNGETEVNLIAGEIEKIVLKEVFLEDKLFLMYKIVNNKDKSFTGFYDMNDDFFVSPYTEYNEYSYLHNAIKGLILETYIICTTDIDKSKTRYYDLKMKILESVEKDIDTIRRCYKKYNKDNLLLSSAEVNSYIRKLPINAIASDEAKENARKYGIELKPGETFVKSFEKTVYKKIINEKK